MDLCQINIKLATIADYPLILNMGRFYEYDMSRYCQRSWEGEDGGYPSKHLIKNFKTYFEEESRRAYLINVKDEIAGFALINKVGTLIDVDWNMGEFFILAKFQGKGIALEAAQKIWQMHPGKWEVSVIPNNLLALAFWRKAISSFTQGSYHEEVKIVDYDLNQPTRYIFRFTTNLS